MLEEWTNSCQPGDGNKMACDKKNRPTRITTPEGEVDFVCPECESGNLQHVLYGDCMLKIDLLTVEQIEPGDFTWSDGREQTDMTDTYYDEWRCGQCGEEIDLFAGWIDDAE